MSSPTEPEPIEIPSRAIHPFPVLRWLALVWMAVWLPAYVRVWGWANLLHWCDVAVVLACIGLWYGSGLLLSSQALSSLLAGVAWGLDAGSRLATGHHLFGGTEYMWDARYPMWVRLLSLFHVGLPVVLLWTLRKQGYDGRGLAVQSAIGRFGRSPGGIAVLPAGTQPQLCLSRSTAAPRLGTSACASGSHPSGVDRRVVLAYACAVGPTLWEARTDSQMTSANWGKRCADRALITGIPSRATERTCRGDKISHFVLRVCAGEVGGLAAEND